MKNPKIIRAHSYDPSAGYGPDGSFYVLDKSVIPFRTDFQLTRENTIFSNDGPSFFSSGAYVCAKALKNKLGVWEVIPGQVYLIPNFAILEVYEFYDEIESGTSGTSGTSSTSGTIKYYGSFIDTSDQSAGSTTQAYAVIFSSIEESNGIQIESDGTNPTRIRFLNQGVYNLQFSLQFINSGVNDANFNVWFRKNNSDIANSNSQFTIPKPHAGGDGALVAALNFMTSLNANDYIQLMWQTESTGVSIQTLPSGTTPVTPITPGAIFTAHRVD